MASEPNGRENRMTDEREEPGVLSGLDSFTDPAAGDGGSRRLWTAFWAAADKGLPMLYGVAVVLIVVGRLETAEFGIWVVFQTIFLAISLFGDYLLLQPMVKFSAEHEADAGPIITAGSFLYITCCLLLAAPLSLFPEFFSGLLKTGEIGTAAFVWMIPTIGATILRNISIRILQIDLKIVLIFLLDLVYFGGFIALIILGWQSGSLDSTADMISYNLYALAASSLFGAAACGRMIVPVFHDLRDAARKIIDVAHHQGGTGLMTIVQQNVDVMIVSGTRGSVAVGFYSIARIFYRIYEALREAGQLLLISATSNAWSRQDEEKVQDLSILATAALAAILYPMTIVLIVLAPIVVEILIAGGMIPLEYEQVILPFQWLIASGFAMPFTIVTTSVLLGIGKTRDLFVGMAIGTSVMIVAGLILTWLLGAQGMAMGVFFGNVTIASILTARMNRSIDFSFREVMKRSRGLGRHARSRLRRR